MSEAQPKRKRSPAAPDAWEKPDALPADATAMQALHAGEASPEQQKRALNWIIEAAARTYDLHYRPGSERDTAFALGRGFVGQQVVHLLRVNPRSLEK